MEKLGGLSPGLRQKLTILLREAAGAITVSQAAEILGLSSTEAAKTMAQLANHGWLSRVKRGLYIPVPLESLDPNPALEDPWLVAVKAFAPCYIGGWSAAEHWNLTEQIFQTTIVLTTRRQRQTMQNLNGSAFRIKTVRTNALDFGLRDVWRGAHKVAVSDPARTVIDMMDDPLLGGGIRTVSDILMEYLQSEHKNIAELLDCARLLGNGAVYKRLGFLMEQLVPTEIEAIESCRVMKTKGLARLDPALPQDHLVTAWNLWIPKGWNGKRSDI